jgi:hypothetical protein
MSTVILHHKPKPTSGKGLKGIARTMRRIYRTGTRNIRDKYKVSKQYKQYKNILYNLSVRRRVIHLYQKHKTTTQVKRIQLNDAPNGQAVGRYDLYQHVSHAYNKYKFMSSIHIGAKEKNCCFIVEVTFIHLMKMLEIRGRLLKQLKQ